MRKSFLVSLLAFGSLPAFVAVGCADSFKDCANTSSCPPDEGDGDGSGGSGDGDGETGGSSVGGEGGETTADPCDACSGETPACSDSDECVECTGDEHCSVGVCDAANGVCVGCVDAADCGAELPVCEANACAGCTLEADCAGHSDTPVCDAESGACVGCLDETDCGGKVCDPDTLTCTDVDANDVGDCEPCEFDAQCERGLTCVLMMWDDPTSDSSVGSFCLWVKETPALEGGPGGVCGTFAPYAGTESIESVNSSFSGEVCAPRTTTCVALKQHATAVAGCTAITEDAACGASNQNDALCELDGDSMPLCTIPCGGADDRDCPVGFACVDGSSGKHCEI